MIFPEQRLKLEQKYLEWIAENGFEDRPANVIEFLHVEWLLDEIAVETYC